MPTFRSSIRRPGGSGELARAVAVARMATVPFLLATGVAAGESDVWDAAFLVVAAFGLVYSAGVLGAVRRGRAPDRRLVAAVDVAVIAGLAATADATRTTTGIAAAVLLLATWAFIVPPRDLPALGAAASGVILAVQAAVNGTDGLLRLAFALVVVTAIAYVGARALAERRARVRTLVAQVDEMRAEARDLERRERGRIAQLLHDDALQRLLAARQDLDAGVEDGDAEALARALDGLGAATRSLRGLTLSIDDAELDAAGVAAAVRRVADATTERTGRAVEVAVDDRVPAGGTIVAVVREVLAHVERVTSRGAVVVRVDDAGDPVGVEVTVETEEPLVVPPEPVLGRLRGAGATLRPAPNGLALALALPRGDLARGEAAARSLRSEREWAAALVAALPDPFIVSTADLRLVEVSDRFVALTGWSRAELLGAPPGEIPYWPPAQRPALRRMALGLNEELSHEVEMEIVRKDGTHLDVIASAQIVDDPRGGRTLQLVTFKDVTRRLAVERRLRVERDVSFALRTLMGEAYLWTEDGVVVDVNAAFCELLGRGRDDLLAERRPYGFLAEETRDIADAFSARIESEGHAEDTFDVVRADGVRVPVRVTGVRVHDDVGGAAGRVLLVRPVGEAPPLADGARSVADGAA